MSQSISLQICGFSEYANMSAASELERLKSSCSTAKTVMEVDDKELGEVFRYHRQDSGMTLKYMAAQLGISQSFLSDCELGKRKLNASHQLRYVQEIMNYNASKKRGERLRKRRGR